MIYRVITSAYVEDYVDVVADSPRDALMQAEDMLREQCDGLLIRNLQTEIDEFGGIDE